MRIMIKGGVWKNTEDEILKAAVMKYGLNQWARISSLLVRKSAKQCKARWYEWLDPSIKKTEWTREEDEKLLHLAKLMPCQWRTIAPIVGRTPAQCLDRYERLLDQAVSKDVAYDPRDDPRRLRPGEIDPNPESKPARPDAVDMDEDEKEMLSEARARLANTRGKKAKRKAREKQLEEARRLAMLQKTRELKAAGIEVRGKFKNAKAIDYNAEVAFELKPQTGFYSTEEENRVTRTMQQEFRPVTVEELEGRRRKDIEEALIKKDVKRQKLNEAHDAPGAVAAQMGLDSEGPRRRGKLMLPAPQVSEAELEQIARLGVDGALEASVSEGAGGNATRTLLGAYGQTPRMALAGATPMRTPRTGGTGGDRIMAEAAALAKLQGMGTVLEGGETGVDVGTMDFGGVTPRNVVAATPNPLANMTPSVRGGGSAAAAGGAGGATGARVLAIAGAAATPSVAGTPLRGGAGVGPGATPLVPMIRDELGLNEADVVAAALEGGGSRRQVAARQAAVRSELRERLAGLPAPQNEYAFEVPEVPQDEPEEAMEEDLADVRARRAREEAERRRIEELKKSKALQRQLPRPLSVDALPQPRPAAHQASSASGPAGLLVAAEEAVAAEVAALLNHDAMKYPVRDARTDKKKGDRGAAKPAGPAPPLEEFELGELEEADKLVQQEVAYLKSAWDQAGFSPDDYRDVWQAVHRDLIYLPSRGKYERAASATNVDRIDSLKSEFECVRGDMEREARRASKLEAKLGLLLAGLQRRHGDLGGRAAELWAQVRDAAQELVCFKALHERELRAAPERLEALAESLASAQRREGELQERYKALCKRKEELTAALEQVQPAQAQAQVASA
ncbi:hypothetical protein HYH03_003857 [Edaphochlamys debaryana]|uniref:Uncharacterized protein n=1 Tax=Edaphochlamys debaryana TaxID=47281 RepID=A0A836C3V7_9CHLO|nr:hypothetical protein HYH03_003857 [Edaphochlamys debaryana]|eukprot:KAG2498099.1 hypothetical protein HYH03_003857 [Edaphochlamys debaryana]